MRMTIQLAKDSLRFNSAYLQIVKPFLNKIYGDYASITVITGEWKTGKTDLGLKIMEWLKALGLASKLASNVETSGKSDVRYINDMLSLKAWAYSDKVFRKAYLYDEAIASTPSRKAMSGLNTDWLRFIPQLSKAKCQLIVSTQETDYTETSFLHPRFIRAIWEKTFLPPTHPQYRKMVKLYSKLLDHIPVFRNVPRCMTGFDPLKIATFHREPQLSELNVPFEINVALDYGAGVSSLDLVKKYGELNSRTQAMRTVQYGIRQLKECYLLHTIVEGKKARQDRNNQKANNG